MDELPWLLFNELNDGRFAVLPVVFIEPVEHFHTAF